MTTYDMSLTDGYLLYRIPQTAALGPLEQSDNHGVSMTVLCLVGRVLKVDLLGFAGQLSKSDYALYVDA